MLLHLLEHGTVIPLPPSPSITARMRATSSIPPTDLRSSGAWVRLYRCAVDLYRLCCISRGSGEVLGPSPLPCLSPAGRAGAASHPSTALGTWTARRTERGKAVPASPARGQPGPALACLRPCPAPGPSGRPAGRGAGGGRAGPRRAWTPLGAGSVGPQGPWGTAGCCCWCCCWAPRGRCCGRRSRRSPRSRSAPSGAWRGAPGWRRGSPCPCGTSTSRRSARPDTTSPAPRQVPIVCSGAGRGAEGRPCPGLRFRRRTRLEVPTPLPLPSLLPFPVPCGGCAVAVPGPAPPGHAGWQSKHMVRPCVLVLPSASSKQCAIYRKEPVLLEVVDVKSQSIAGKW